MANKSAKGMVVAVGGPPHSGKSVFLAELYRQLLLRRSSGFAFLERGCPDGEGMWSDETDPAVVKQIRRKGSFSDEFMGKTLKSVENLGKFFPLVLVDLGGRRTAENAEILARCTHLMIVSSKEDENEAWSGFAGLEGVSTLAVFSSSLVRTADGSIDQTVRSDADLTGSVAKGNLINLDREAGKDPYQETVSLFADWLISKVEG